MMEPGHKVVDGDQVFMVTETDNSQRFRRKITVVAVDSYDVVSDAVTQTREYTVRWPIEPKSLKDVVVGDVIWTPNGWHCVIAIHRSKVELTFVFQSRSNWTVTSLELEVAVRKGHYV